MSRRWTCAIRAASGLLLASTLLGCSAAVAPAPPPALPTSSPSANATLAAAAATPLAQAATAIALPAPTLPAVISEAAEQAPPPPGSTDAPLPTARDLARGTIAALLKVKSARLLATLSNGHRTDLIYVAPDRATLVEQDANNREVARYVIIGDTGYQNLPSLGGNWTRTQHPDFRKQAQVFRALQVALATGKPRPVEADAEVEVVEWQGRPAFRATFDYSASPELEELGLMRTAQGNSVTVTVDPTTWLPLHSREETQGYVTEVDFVEFDEPRTIEPPIP
jgi:hypothetical protein